MIIIIYLEQGNSKWVNQKLHINKQFERNGGKLKETWIIFQNNYIYFYLKKKE